MLAIIKFEDNGKSLFWDITGVNPHLDKILIPKISTASFPLFDMGTEDIAGIARRKSDSEWAIELSFRLQYRSALDKTIKQFFREGSRNYKYFAAMDVAGYKFSGTFKSGDVESDFTILEGKWHCSFIVRESLYEFKQQGETFTTSRETENEFSALFGIGLNQDKTFEQFMRQYLMSNWADVELPADIDPIYSFANKCEDNSIKFRTDFYHRMGGLQGFPPGFTNWSAVSRMEVLDGLRAGLGFEYDLRLQFSPQQIYDTIGVTNSISSLFKLKIFWEDDLFNEAPVVLTKTKRHRERTIPKTKKYLFIQYRHKIHNRLSNEHSLGDFTATIIRGIITDGVFFKDSDSMDNLNPVYPHLPFFGISDHPLIFKNETLLQYFEAPQPPQLHPSITYERSEVNIMEGMPLYSCPNMGGAKIGQGSMAFARIFSADEPAGFLPIQRYVMRNYRKYITNSGLKGKEVIVKLKDVPNLTWYKVLALDDGAGLRPYKVMDVPEFDYPNRRVTLMLQQLNV